MSKVIVEKQDSMWTVHINAPERRNALGREVVQGLLDVAEAVAEEKAVRCVVLTGAGEKAFCAGADLKERKGMPESEVRQFVSLLNRMMNTIANSPKVWIGAIHGACLGGGLELALCTDLRVANTNVVLGLPEVRLGILPGAGGTQRLPRLIGVARAKELILTGTRFGADKALQLGVVNRVADDHIAAANELAAEVCKGGTNLSDTGETSHRRWLGFAYGSRSTMGACLLRCDHSDTRPIRRAQGVCRKTCTHLQRRMR